MCSGVVIARHTRSRSAATTMLRSITTASMNSSFLVQPIGYTIVPQILSICNQLVAEWHVGSNGGGLPSFSRRHRVPARNRNGGGKPGASAQRRQQCFPCVTSPQALAVQEPAASFERRLASSETP